MNIGCVLFSLVKPWDVELLPFLLEELFWCLDTFSCEWLGLACCEFLWDAEGFICCYLESMLFKSIVALPKNAYWDISGFTTAPVLVVDLLIDMDVWLEGLALINSSRIFSICFWYLLSSFSILWLNSRRSTSNDFLTCYNSFSLIVSRSSSLRFSRFMEATSSFCWTYIFATTPSCSSYLVVIFSMCMRS